MAQCHILLNYFVTPHAQIVNPNLWITWMDSLQACARFPLERLIHVIQATHTILQLISVCKHNIQPERLVVTSVRRPFIHIKRAYRHSFTTLCSSVYTQAPCCLQPCLMRPSQMKTFTPPAPSCHLPPKLQCHINNIHTWNIMTPQNLFGGEEGWGTGPVHEIKTWR